MIAEAVEFWFDQTSFDPTLFTLNDSVKGELDSVYTLGGTGDQPTDVSAYCTGYSITRGRSRELDQFPVGSATITLLNYDARFLPDQYTDSPGPYGAGNITVGKRVTIRSADQIIFDGRVDRWNLTYNSDLTVTVTVTVLDSLATLGRRTIDACTPSGATAGVRINEILDRPEIAWTANRQIDTGLYTLSTSTAVKAGTNAVQYLQLVAQTERGRLFASREGVLTFLDSSNLYGSLPVCAFDDTGTLPDSVPFMAADLELSSDLLFTDVTVAHVLGDTVATYTNSAARSTYGIRRWDITGLLLGPTEATADTQAQNIADQLGDEYSTLEARINRLTVRLDDDTAGLVNSLEIGDVVHVVWTPRGGDQIDQYFFVEGLAHQVNLSNHLVNVQLSPAPHPPFILDDLTWGLLNTGVLSG